MNIISSFTVMYLGYFADTYVGFDICYKFYVVEFVYNIE